MPKQFWPAGYKMCSLMKNENRNLKAKAGCIEWMNLDSLELRSIHICCIYSLVTSRCDRTSDSSTLERVT